MDIRVPQKHYKKYKKLYDKNIHKYFLVSKKDNTAECGVKITLDHTIDIPAIITLSNTGEFLQFSKGKKNVISFLKNGYVRIKEKCPFKILSKCKAEKCRFYLIKNLTGDCSFFWRNMVEM